MVDFKIRQEANDFGLRPDKSGAGEQQLQFLRSSAEENLNNNSLSRGTFTA